MGLNQKLLQILIGLCLVFFITGCEEDGDISKISEGQKCLDDINEDSTTLSADAQACIAKVDGVKGSQAAIIRCAGGFIGGGITTSRITDAYINLKDSDNATAGFMFYLALDNSGGASSTNSEAQEIVDDCEETGMEGLVYIANIMKAATALSFVGGGLVIDPTNPNSPSAADIQTFLDGCEANPSSCSSDDTAEAVEAIAESYCAGSQEDSDFCQDVNAAVDSGSTSAALACLLGGGDFTPPNTCN